MAAWNEEMLVGLAPAPWQPLSARPATREPLPLRMRLFALGAIAVLHLLAVLALLAVFERNRRTAFDDAIVVDFIEGTSPIQPVEAPTETVTTRMPEPPKARRRTAPPAADAETPGAVDVPMQAIATPQDERLHLYNPDGSVRVPEDMLDQLDRQFGEERQFSYQIPHLDDAKKYFERHPALAYEKTRFDQYWTPDSDALTAVLTKMVEATTKEVRLKVPGTNGSYVVCKVSILAVGGACGVLTNGADWNGPQDDPNTLNEEEQRQCAAWWQQIIQAKTQDAWRATKKLYERSCRKPLLRQPVG